MTASSQRVRTWALRRALAQWSHIYPVLAITLSFMLMGGLRATATPPEDNLGAHPDEVWHFARSLEWARLLAHTFGVPVPYFSGRDLIALNSTVGLEDLCELGSFSRPFAQCGGLGDLKPFGSGEVRGSGVYLLHGLVQLLLPMRDTALRLLLGRIAALGVGLVLAWVAYRLGCLLFDDRTNAVAAVALIILLPSVNGILSTLSTEGPALLAVAVLLWVTSTIFIRGFSFGRLFGLGLGIMACMFTKVTALAVLPSAGFLLMSRVGLRGRGLLLLSVSIGIVGLTIGIGNNFLALREVGAAYWYVERPPAMVPIHGVPAQLAQAVYSRKGVNEGDISSPPLGDIPLSTTFMDQQGRSIGVVQFLPGRVARRLAGKRLSVGAWVKANGGSLVKAPEVIFASDNVAYDVLSGLTFAPSIALPHNKNMNVSGEWHFVANEVQMPAQVREVGVRLYHEDAVVLWDGVTLAVGSYAAYDQPPEYDDATATTGEWGGTRFENLLKNGSGEVTWNGVSNELRVFVNRFGTSTWAQRLDGKLFSLYDFDRTGAGYLAGLRAMFATFWGSFVGGDWPGLARWHYGVAAGVLLLAGLGWMRRVWRRHAVPEAMPDSVTLAFLLAVLLYIFIGVMRMEVSAEWVPPLFYATSRHVLPAITPVVFLTIGGLAQFFSKRVTRVVLALLIAGVFMANTWMLLRVEMPYFSCPLEIRWACTPL